MSFKVKAVFDYNSGHEDDLPFSIGQIITVTEEEDADWYGGEYVDENGVKQEGIFPRNFVEKYEPTAPPRPTRTRTKHQSEQQSVASEAPAATTPPLLSPKLPAHDPEENEHVKVTSPTRTSAAPAPAPAAAPQPPAPKPAEPVETFSPPPPAPKPAPAPAPAVTSSPAPKPAPTQSKPSGPPPVSEKPSSFRDRIAAFNKAAAPPVAPFKPSGLGAGNSGFIKKPFVAPPPSRNAYVPPAQSAPVAKVYRREEDPEIKEKEAENLETAEKAGLVPGSSTGNQNAEDEDQPKTLTLKERLALLQKQQMEAAQRHADAVTKKEKPKRPAKKRMESHEGAGEESEASIAPPQDRRDSEDHAGKKSMDEPRPPRLPPQPRRKSSKGPEIHDGNEADMSGAGEMTEGQEDELTEREDSDERSKKHVATVAKQEDEDLDEEEVQPEDEDDDVDPEVRRKEELRARMARIAGGMGGMGGMGAMFGGPVPTGAPAPPKKKKTDRQAMEASEEPTSPTTHAPPVPMMMALPGMSRVKSNESQPRDDTEPEEEDDETELRTPHQEHAPPNVPSREPAAAPPVPGGRPAPPPVPTDSRPPPPLPPAAVFSPSEGSESGDELSEHPGHEDLPKPSQPSSATRGPPPLPPVAAPSPLTSPASPQSKRRSYLGGEGTPISPTVAPPVPSGNRRDSRLPPPVPGSAPALPPSQSRPPPPPPPGALSRSSTADTQQPLSPTRLVSRDNHDHDDEEGEEEVTEYEGDYDTDIASSVPHKDALKSHQRESSFEDATSVRSPIREAPPPSLPPLVPSASAPRGPPPFPSHPPPESRRSVDVPRAAPPPPPPAKEAPQYDNDDYDPYNYASPSAGIPVASPQPPTPARRTTEESYFGDASWHQASLPERRGPPPAAPSNRAPARQSLDVHRQLAPGRRSVDVTRPSMESGYVANDVDLATHTGWWLKPNSVPPQLQGRKDIYFESEESKSSSPQGKTTVTRDIYVLFQDYSQTVITARYDPQDQSDIHLEQRHEAPPRTLRQDQLEQAYERFGRAIGDAVSSKKDTVVGDGTPQALIYELLKPHRGALLPVGTRAYGALVYSNLANASTTQNDEIRPGDIISIRNAKFQGKHGPMHAKYAAEVGKPDHVGIVSEWDGTKKKVRAWEQGRESKKVKVESFKLDDLRSGEVKIWRVMPRSWVGWEGGN